MTSILAVVIFTYGIYFVLVLAETLKKIKKQANKQPKNMQYT